MESEFGAKFRQVESREHLGEPALVGTAVRFYDTTVEDLWEAITEPRRLARWFLPVSGDLRVGGRYQLKGNAGGTIARCHPPHALDLSWEFGGGTSYVNLRLTPDGERTRLWLEHIAPTEGPGNDHLLKYGPAATGIGWDLSLWGLRRHLADPTGSIDPAEYEAWAASTEGIAFIRRCGEAWGEAHVLSGADPEDARARAGRTVAFYSGS